MKHEDAVISAQLSPDSRRIVTASADNRARFGTCRRASASFIRLGSVLEIQQKEEVMVSSRE